MTFECVERDVPKTADFFQRCNKFPNCFCAIGCEFVDLLAAVSFRRDQAGVLQNPRMLAYRRTAHREAAREFSGAARFARDATKKFAAGRIGKREDGVIHWHRERYVTHKLHIVKSQSRPTIRRSVNQE